MMVSDFKYPSYVQDIMGPLFFDYGFGPFRWVCSSGNPDDLATSDAIAAEVLEDMCKTPRMILKARWMIILNGLKGHVKINW